MHFAVAVNASFPNGFQGFPTPQNASRNAYRGPQPAPSCPPDPDAQPSNYEIHFSPLAKSGPKSSPNGYKQPNALLMILVILGILLGSPAGRPAGWPGFN